MQCEALRRGNSLGFSKGACLEEKRVRSKVIPRKVGVGLKRRGELSKKRWCWKLVWYDSTEKKETSNLLKLRGRHQCSGHRSSRISAP